MKKLAGPTESPADPRRDNSHRMRSYAIVFNRIPSDTNRWKQKLKLKLKRKLKRRYIPHISRVAATMQKFNPMGSSSPVVRLNTLPATRSGNHSHVLIPPVCAWVPLPPGSLPGRWPVVRWGPAAAGVLPALYFRPVLDRVPRLLRCGK